MRFILNMIKITACGIFLLLSLPNVAMADTTRGQDDQLADRIGGQAGLQVPFDRRTITADSVGGMRVGGQAGLQIPFERRTLAADSVGGMRVGGQAGLQTSFERRTIAADSVSGTRVDGQENDAEKPNSEAK
jgi:hypothetical protein